MKASGKEPKLLIIGKEHTFETTREVPVGSIAEAIKAARMMDDVSPFSGFTFIVAEKTETGHCLVTFSTVKHEVCDKLQDKCWAMVPEALLLKLLCKKPNTKGQLALQYGKRKVVATIQGQDLRCWVEPQAESAIDNNQYSTQLLEALFSQAAYYQLQSFNYSRLKRVFKTVPWWRLSAVSMVLVVMYFGVSSAWLSWRYEALQVELDSQRDDLDRVFRLQQNIREYETARQYWQTNEQPQLLRSPVWPVFIDMIDQGIEIQGFTINEDGIQVRGQAKKATEAIGYLSQLDAITVPESVSPVRKSRGEEVFSVKFRLVQPGEKKNES